MEKQMFHDIEYYTALGKKNPVDSCNKMNGFKKVVGSKKKKKRSLGQKST